MNPNICAECRLEQSFEGDTSLWIVHSRKTLNRKGAWPSCVICNRARRDESPSSPEPEPVVVVARQEEQEEEQALWNPVVESVPFGSQLQAIWGLLLLDAGVDCGGARGEDDDDVSVWEWEEEVEEEEEKDADEGWPQVLAPIPQRPYRGPLNLDVYESGEGEGLTPESSPVQSIPCLSAFSEDEEDEDDDDNADDNLDENSNEFLQSAAGQRLLEIDIMLSSPWSAAPLDLETEETY